MTTTRYPASGARRVVLLGITVGTAVLVLAMWAGARPHFGNAPAFISLIVGTILLWLLLIGGVALAVALLATFGEAIVEGLGQLVEWSARTIGTLFRRAHQWAEPRWQNRRPGLNDAQRQRDQGGVANVCAACGHPASGAADPLVIAEGYRVHRSHTTELPDGSRRLGTRDVPDPRGPMTGASPDLADALEHAREESRDGRPRTVYENDGDGNSRPVATYLNGEVTRSQSQPQQEGTGTTMATTSTRSVPTYWHSAATTVADFHPDTEAELLDWMSGEVSGILAYGEAVAEVHEHCVSGIRLDPAAMATLHDVADAAADFAEAMARAREKFRQVYEAPREFVSDGGVLPKDGDFLTGDDAG